MTMRPSRAVRRLPLLAAAVGLAVVAHTAAVAAAPRADAPHRERVASIEIGIDGKGGEIATESEYLGGTDGRYRFGTACGAAIAEPVLARLLGSLTDQRPLTVVAKDEPGGPPCITRLVFHAQ